MLLPKYIGIVLIVHHFSCAMSSNSLLLGFPPSTPDYARLCHPPSQLTNINNDAFPLNILYLTIPDTRYWFITGIRDHTNCRFPHFIVVLILLHFLALKFEYDITPPLIESTLL